mgnify:CR=1 FL=1
MDLIDTHQHLILRDRISFIEDQLTPDIIA